MKFPLLSLLFSCVLFARAHGALSLEEYQSGDRLIPVDVDISTKIVEVGLVQESTEFYDFGVALEGVLYGHSISYVALRDRETHELLAMRTLRASGNLNDVRVISAEYDSNSKNIYLYGDLRAGFVEISDPLDPEKMGETVAGRGLFSHIFLACLNLEKEDALHPQGLRWWVAGGGSPYRGDRAVAAEMVRGQLQDIEGNKKDALFFLGNFNGDFSIEGNHLATPQPNEFFLGACNLDGEMEWLVQSHASQVAGSQIKGNGLAALYSPIYISGETKLLFVCGRTKGWVKLGEADYGVLVSEAPSAYVAAYAMDTGEVVWAKKLDHAEKRSEAMDVAVDFERQKIGVVGNFDFTFKPHFDLFEEQPGFVSQGASDIFFVILDQIQGAPDFLPFEIVATTTVGGPHLDQATSLSVPHNYVDATTSQGLVEKAFYVGGNVAGDLFATYDQDEDPVHLSNAFEEGAPSSNAFVAALDWLDAEVKWHFRSVDGDYVDRVTTIEAHAVSLAGTEVEIYGGARMGGDYSFAGIADSLLDGGVFFQLYDPGY